MENVTYMIILIVMIILGIMAYWKWPRQARVERNKPEPVHIDDLIDAFNKLDDACNLARHRRGDAGRVVINKGMDELRKFLEDHHIEVDWSERD